MKYVYAAFIATLVVAPVTWAQAPKPDDAFARAMFDPQLVLKSAQAIGLSAAQRKAILDELKAAQVALAPLQIDMTDPALELQEMIEQPKVDEAKAVAKTTEVLRIENEVKKRQLVLLIRIKNVLTPEQQATLRAIRDGKDHGDGGAPNTPSDAPST
ncbi:MAG: hypothetical protein U0132_14450 [Gemmatimonadaceae bacterium]